MPHILLIEDEERIRDLIRSLLDSAGHAVTAAPNGGAVIGHLNTSQFDLVITDIMMPETDGLETIRHIRACNPRQRILAISGGAYLGAAKKFGADEILAKPFRKAELLEAIERLLG